MSTNSTVPADTPIDVPAAEGDAPSLRVRQIRRWFMIAAPVIGGLFALLGAWNDPAVGENGRRLWEAYAANPDPLQFKSFGFHYGYAFIMVPALMIAGFVQARGQWLATVAGFLGWLGVATLPGLLVVDFYDSAIGQAAGVDTTEAVNAAMESMWGIQAIILPGMIGFVLALPLAASAAWRAGLVRWWGPVAVVAGIASFTFSGVSEWGVAAMTACFAVFAYGLARGTGRQSG